MTIVGFAFDDGNLDAIAAAGILPAQLLDVLDHAHVALPSRQPTSRARYLVIGHDAGGSCLAIPVAPTHDPEI